MESLKDGIWPWWAIMSDLQNHGMPDVVIDPFSFLGNFCLGEVDGRTFSMSWFSQKLLLISMKEEAGDREFLLRLVDAFSAVIEYRAFCMYRKGGLVTVEWAKDDADNRLRQLEAEGVVGLERLS